jgi:hypothetical protein
MTKKKEPVTLTATSSLILLNDKRVEFLFLSPYYAFSFAGPASFEEHASLLTSNSFLFTLPNL